MPYLDQAFWKMGPGGELQMPNPAPEYISTSVFTPAYGGFWAFPDDCHQAKSEPFRKLRLPRAKFCILGYIHKHSMVLLPELTILVEKQSFSKGAIHPK